MSETELDADLRERWADAAAGEERLSTAQSELASRLAADDGGDVARSHVGRAHQRVSEAYRLSGLLDEALIHKDLALEIWRAQGKVRATFLVELQRALVVAEQGATDAARAQMEVLGEQLAGDDRLAPYYRDFLLEYEARCACLDGDRETAMHRLNEALELRRATRAERIVEWTEHAMGKVRGADDSV